jgi:hypothetical protein
MCDRARDVGVNLVWRSRATLLQDGKLLINGREAGYRWLIGADGMSSQVRRARLDAKAFNQRFGFRRHYEMTPWSEYIEIHWRSTGQIYITPMARDRVCVVLITRNGKVNRENFFEGFPEIARRLEGAPMATMQRGAVSVTRKLSLDRWPGLERRSMKAFASDESFFQELLSVHMSVGKLYSFAVRGRPRLGWRSFSITDESSGEMQMSVARHSRTDQVRVSRSALKRLASASLVLLLSI